MDVTSLIDRANGEKILASWFNSIKTFISGFEGYLDEASDTFSNGASATDVTGWTLDSASYTSGVYEVEISRTTSSDYAFSNGRVVLQYANSAWRIDTGGFIGDADATTGGSGITLTVTESGGIAQVQLATNTIAGTGHVGTIKFRRVVFNA